MNVETARASVQSADGYRAKCRAIVANMAAAIKGACGADVEVTCRTATDWTISGLDADVRAARPVMVAAGLVLESSHYDLTPDSFSDVDDHRYDFWRPV